MKLNRILTSAAVLTMMTLALGASTAFADSRDRGRNERDGRDGRAQSRAESARPQERNAPRVEHAVPRDERSAPRQVAPQNFDRRNFERRDFDRRDFDRRNFERRDFDRRDFGRQYYYAPRFYVPRPYRPGFSLGFGIFFGNPYRYAYPGYGYPAGVAYGGISFGITPADAAVYVDGNYAGIVGSFSEGSQPLTLTPGSHRIELQAPGYVPTIFDVNVIPGQLIPYQGSLQPAYGY